MSCIQIWVYQDPISPTPYGLKGASEAELGCCRCCCSITSRLSGLPLKAMEAVRDLCDSFQRQSISLRGTTRSTRPFWLTLAVMLIAVQLALALLTTAAVLLEHGWEVTMLSSPSGFRFRVVESLTSLHPTQYCSTTHLFHPFCTLTKKLDEA